MSKKRKKNQRTQRRHAARRARAAEQRRSRPRRDGPEGRRRERGPLQSITFTRDGLVEIAEVAGADADAHLAYIDAHEVLPPGYPIDEADQRRQMAMAIFALEDPSAGSDAVLRAIMILGHTPDELALAALSRYASSGRVHAELAKPAASECAMWLDNGGPPRPWRAESTPVVMS